MSSTIRLLMQLFKSSKKTGSIAMPISAIIVGVVMLFIGVFTLAAVEGLFVGGGNLNTCTYADDVGNTNATLASTTTVSAKQNYTVGTVEGDCVLNVHLVNISLGATTVTAHNYMTGATLGIITVPATNSNTLISITPTASAVFSVNYTLAGTGNVTVDKSLSYVHCCDAIVRNPDTISGKYFDQVANTAGTAFTVMGLVLIVIGLTMAIGSLKQMQ